MTAVKAWYAKFAANKYGAIVVRVISVGVGAGVTAFVGDALSVHLLTVPNILNLSLWHGVVLGTWVAAFGAVLTAVQSILTTLVTGLPQLTKGGREAFQARALAARNG